MIDIIRAHMAQFTLAGLLIFFIVLTILEYYRIWKQAIRKFNAKPKELDSAQIIRVMSQQKCGCNWFRTCVPCSTEMARIDREREEGK